MDQEKSKAKLSESGWAEGYDYIVYNHCFAHEKDAKFVKSITDIHKAGKPAIALHCAMHSYHWSIPAKEGEKKAWPEMLGASSKGHGPKAAITVNKVKKYANHPIMKDMPDGWMTPEGELYNVQQVYEGTTVLAYGDNGKNDLKSPRHAYGSIPMEKERFSQPRWDIIIPLCPRRNIWICWEMPFVGSRQSSLSLAGFSFGNGAWISF